MGKQFDKAQQLDDTYVMHIFARKPVEFVSGAGQWLIDDEGNEYRDFLSGIGVVSVGHCNSRVTEAITEQANKLVHVSNYFYVEHRGELAERISDMLAHGTEAVWQSFFANSGAEASWRAYGAPKTLGAPTASSRPRSPFTAGRLPRSRQLRKTTSRIPSHRFRRALDVRRSTTSTRLRLRSTARAMARVPARS